MSNGLQRGKRTGEEWFWRSFLHKDEREDNGSSILGTLSFMVKVQGNTGPEMDLLSCIHSERSASGLFFTQGMKIPFQRELGDVYNHYSACSRPPLKLSGKKRKMVKIWYEISMRYFQSKCVLFMGRETNIFYH